MSCCATTLRTRRRSRRTPGRQPQRKLPSSPAWTRAGHLEMLGLRHGGHIIRNAGGVITDDVRARCASAAVRHPRDRALHHTDCGLSRSTRRVQAPAGGRGGRQAAWARSRSTTRSSTPSNRFAGSGCRRSCSTRTTSAVVYDVDTGRLHEVHSTPRSGHHLATEQQVATRTGCYEWDAGVSIGVRGAVSAG